MIHDYEWIKNTYDPLMLKNTYEHMIHEWIKKSYEPCKSRIPMIHSCSRIPMIHEWIKKSYEPCKSRIPMIHEWIKITYDP